MTDYRSHDLSIGPATHVAAKPPSGRWGAIQSEFPD